MVIVAEDATSRLSKGGAVNAVDLKTVIVLPADNAELGQFVLHGLDSVAFLHALVCNSIDASGMVRVFALCNCREYRRSKESICHWFHIHIGKRPQGTAGLTNDGGRVISLLDGAAHGTQDIDGETSITLQRFGPDVRDGAGCASDRRDRQRIGSGAGVTLHDVFSRVDVLTLRDVISMLLRGGLLHVNSEGPHHRRRHVNVRLGDRLATNESQGDWLLGIRCTHEQRGDILGGDLGSEVDVSTCKSARSSNLQGKAALLLHVFNICAIGCESVDKVTNWPLLHAVVACKNACIHGTRSGKGCDGGEESRSCTGITKVERCRAGFDVPSFAVHHKDFTLILPREGSSTKTLQSVHHNLRVIGVQQVLDADSARAESGKNESSVRDTLRTRGCAGDIQGRCDTRVHLNAGSKNNANFIVRYNAGLGFIRPTDGRQQDHLFLRTVVLLVERHVKEQLVDRAMLACCHLPDPRVLQRCRQTVGGNALDNSSHGNSLQHTDVSGKLGFLDHTNSDTFSVKDLRGQNGFDGVANGVTPVQKVSKTALTLVRGHDVSLVARRRQNSGFENILNTIKSTLARLSLAADSGQNRLCVVFQSREFLLARNGRSLDHLRHSVDKFSDRECFKELQVNVDSRRLPDRANQILPQWGINSSLSTN